MTQPYIICMWCEGKGLLHEFLPGMTVLGTTIKRVSEVMVPRLLVPWTDETLYRELKAMKRYRVDLVRPERGPAVLDKALEDEVDVVVIIDAHEFSVDPSDIRLCLRLLREGRGPTRYARSVTDLLHVDLCPTGHKDPAKFFRSEKNVLRPTRWLEAQGRTSPEVY